MKNFYFYGNKVSEYGIENGRVDYATFAKAFDAVYCDFEALNKVAYDFEPVGGSECYYELGGTYYSEEEKDAKIEELEELLDNAKSEEEADTIREQIDELEEEHYHDIFQWYIVPENALSILEENNEIVYFSNTV